MAPPPPKKKKLKKIHGLKWSFSIFNILISSIIFMCLLSSLSLCTLHTPPQQNISYTLLHEIYPMSESWISVGLIFTFFKSDLILLGVVLYHGFYRCSSTFNEHFQEQENILSKINWGHYDWKSKNTLLSVPREQSELGSISYQNCWKSTV